MMIAVREMYAAIQSSKFSLPFHKNISQQKYMFKVSTSDWMYFGGSGPLAFIIGEAKVPTVPTPLLLVHKLQQLYWWETIS